LNGIDLREGDGAAVNGEDLLIFVGKESAEVLLFDVA
jgi:hypothetical protein